MKYIPILIALIVLSYNNSITDKKMSNKKVIET